MLILIDGKRGNQNVAVINESGLYSLIMSSRKPQAKAFKKWVTAEVLPTICKTGGYVNNDEMFVNTYLLMQMR
ncbi:BRO-N domain-containing protein [Bacillus cereus group sp. MYBK30-1]|uniref:BRO-N domain-containing protein n=1 Tax=unclassified Bacillus cereus group TaxID=2750818 RepID=UPI003F78E0DB